MIASVWSDIYLYRRLLSRLLARWPKILFIIFSVIVNAEIVFFTVKYVLTHSKYTVTNQVVLLWAMLLFFIVFFPKVIYVLFSLVDRFKGRGGKRKSVVFSRIGAVAAIAVAGLMIHGVLFNRFDLRVERVVISSPKLPAAFDGYKIALFSDVHIGNIGDNSPLMQALVDSIAAYNVDMAINCGDIINTTESEMTAVALSQFGAISATDGVYSVFGNHDLGYLGIPVETSREENIERLRAKLRQIGWNILENESIKIGRGGDSITLAGVNCFSDPLSSHYDPQLDMYDIEATAKGVTDSTFNILLSHNPHSWDSIVAHYPFDLTLSGHLHAMQVKFGSGRGAVSPAMLADYWSGHYSENNRHLYITDGIGYVLYPMRIGSATPELTIIELRREK